MAYTKNVWVDNDPTRPISAARMAHIEDGVGVADTAINTHLADITNPHATTKAQVGLSAVDNTSDATKNAATVTLTNKTLTTVGFQGTAPITKPTVSGSRGGNAALASLLTALASYGLIVDSTTS